MKSEVIEVKNEVNDRQLKRTACKQYGVSLR